MLLKKSVVKCSAVAVQYISTVCIYYFSYTACILFKHIYYFSYTGNVAFTNLLREWMFLQQAHAHQNPFFLQIQNNPCSFDAGKGGTMSE